MAIGAAPELREQVSLNGTWEFTPAGKDKTTIPVPEYWDARPGFKTSQALYERQVTVPESFAGKRIRLEFEGVNQIAQVSVNGKEVGFHIGGWIPFAIDITDHVTPGKPFMLGVDVKGGSHQPIVSATGAVQWPVGWYGFESRWGIVFDVWLRAYGKVSIEDARIATSYRQKNISVEYQLCNNDRVAHTVVMKAVAMLAPNGSVEKTLRSQPILLAAGESKTATLTETWNSPAMWFPYPDKRQSLYHLRSTLIEGDAVIDQETRRFGFREVWIEGRHYMLNGIRLNLWGDNITDHHEGYANRRYSRMTRETWPQTVDSLFGMNIRFVRFHMGPADPFVLDVCDEKGLLMMEESAIYAREYLRPDKIDIRTYQENGIRWIGPWIRSRRNHASIIQWSAENEMVLFSQWPKEAVKAWFDEVSRLDPTRPVSGDGDSDPGSAAGGGTLNLHYPEGYLEPWIKPIYGYSLVNPGVPNGIGEFLTSYGRNGDVNQWMHGLIVRGLRYTDWTDIRPYNYGWIWSGGRTGKPQENQTNPVQTEPTLRETIQQRKVANLRNGQAFVALFDKDYDLQGVETLREERWPQLQAGKHEKRILALYNDEFADSNVLVEIQVKTGEKIVASGKRVVNVPLGGHVDIPCEFQTPFVGQTNLDLVLMTFKGGALKFSENRRFRVAGENNPQRTVSSEVIIGEPRPLNLRIGSELEWAKPFDSVPTGRRGVVRLTLKNLEKDAVVEGHAGIQIDPAGGGKVIDYPMTGYSLKPGEQLRKDFMVEIVPGQSRIRTISSAMGLAPSELPVEAPLPLARIVPVDLDQLSGALNKIPSRDIVVMNGQTLARIKWAVSGENLAVQAEVLDARIKPDVKDWTETALDVFASVPRSTVVRQVGFHPQSDRGGKLTLHQNGDIQPMPQFPWRAKTLTETGYKIEALIPLELFNLEQTPHEFLMECAVSAAPPVLPGDRGRPTPQYATLFRSQGAYKNNSRFIRLIVEE